MPTGLYAQMFKLFKAKLVTLIVPLARHVCRQGDPIPIPCPDRKLEHLIVGTSKPILSL